MATPPQTEDFGGEGGALTTDESPATAAEGEGDGKGKASRWQIGTSALSVLEQVYLMEPFPGLETRRELSKKLNVSVRQVQVWFQNKRQRERKISRSKGLYSTPGLPDTPQASLAKAAAAAGLAPDAFRTLGSAHDATAQQSRVGMETEEASSDAIRPAAVKSDQVAASAGTQRGSATPAAATDCAADRGQSSVEPRSATDGGAALLKRAQSADMQRQWNETDASRHQGSPEKLEPPAQAPRLAGLPMTRAKTCDGQSSCGAGSASFPQPTSLDDMEMPLGLTSFDACIGSRSASAPSEPAALPGQGTPMTQSQPRSKQQIPPQAAAMANMMRYRAGLSLPDLNLPWLSTHLPATSEQAEMHCRAAVAAAAAAMGGNTRNAQSANLQAWMMRQILAKQFASGGLSLQQQHNLLANLDPIAAMDDIAVEDLPTDLQQELLGATTDSVPWVGETPSTASVLSGNASRGACSHNPGGPGPGGMGDDGDSSMTAGGPRKASRTHPSMKSKQRQRAGTESPADVVPGALKPASLPGLPFKHSGVSGILDDMSLETVHDDCQSDASSMDTIPAPQHGSQSSLAPATAASDALVSPTAPAYAASTSDEKRQQAAADQHVQVITSKDEPFQIVWASQAWLQLCEYKPEQVTGRTLDMIQGPLTSRSSVDKLMTSIRAGSSVTLDMINYSSTGKPFSHTLRVEPLRDSKGERQCFQATSTNIQFLNPHLSEALQPSDSGMSRVSSDLAINEMLDLFDNGDSNAQLARSPLRQSSPAPHLSDENAVVDAFLSMA